MSISTLAALVTEVGILLGVVVPVIIRMEKLVAGERCQLRSDILRIYYDNRETETIRQYEYENFVLLYEAYKALKGNSFIDKIYKDVQTWEIIN